MTEPLKPKNDDENELTKLKKQMFYSKIIVGSIITIVLVLYFSNFHVSVSVDNGDWGTFGDFFGGILNPVIASFALYWLITSVNLQIQELKKTNEALEKTVETAEKQQSQASIQNFESLFFQLLKTKNDSLDDIEYKNQNYDYNDNPTDITELKSVDAIKQHIIDFKNNPKGDWLKYYEEKMLDYTGSYFRICYQIVKLINKSDILQASIPINEDKSIVYSIEQKKYFDIFRATLTKHEIEAFFFNCLNQHGNKKFKKLIEKYGLFEPLPIDHDRSNEKNHRLTRYAYLYEPIVFEENVSWKNYFNEISKINVNISLENLDSTFKKLLSTGIIIPSIIHNLIPNTFEQTSGFCYSFNGNIKIEDVFNIFSEENIKSIKCSPLYTNPKFEINEREQRIKNINQYIDDCISYFNNNVIENYMDQVAPIGLYPEHRKSINQLNEMIKEVNIEISQIKKKIELLDQKLISAQQSETTLTAFILIKYGISYTEYSAYMKSKQPVGSL